MRIGLSNCSKYGVWLFRKVFWSFCSTLIFPVKNWSLIGGFHHLCLCNNNLLLANKECFSCLETINSRSCISPFTKVNKPNEWIMLFFTLCLVLFSNILSYCFNWGLYYACTGGLEQVQFGGAILIWNLMYLSCDSMKALSRILFLPRHIATRIHMEARDAVLICGLTSSFGNMNNFYCYIGFHPWDNGSLSISLISNCSSSQV